MAMGLEMQPMTITELWRGVWELGSCAGPLYHHSK